MKRATISNLKNQLSKYLRYVKHGEVVVVLDRGVPVAEIQPRGGHAASEGRLFALERKGIIRRGDPAQIDKFSPPSSKKESGVLSALLKEREEGR